MAKLPHIKNSQVAQDIAEDLTLNRFNMLITPPAGIVAPAWLSDEIFSVGGLDALDKLPEIVKQKSRGHDRAFNGSFLDDTTIELTITMNLNLHGENADDAVIHKMWKSWSNRIRNEDTGATSLKRDCVGKCTLDQHNKIGGIWRSIQGIRVLLQEINGLDEAGLEAGEPVQLVAVIVIEDKKVSYGGDALQA